MLSRKFIFRRRISRRACFRSGIQTCRRAAQDLFAMSRQRGNGMADISQQQIRLTCRHKAWIFPHRDVVFISIRCIGRRQKQRDVFSILWCGKFHADFLSRGERLDGNLPRLRTIPFADMSDGGESPQSLLPLHNRGGESRYAVRFRITPLCADHVEHE